MNELPFKHSEPPKEVKIDEERESIDKAAFAEIDHLRADGWKVAEHAFKTDGRYHILLEKEGQEPCSFAVSRPYPVQEWGEKDPSKDPGQVSLDKLNGME